MSDTNQDVPAVEPAVEPAAEPPAPAPTWSDEVANAIEHLKAWVRREVSLSHSGCDETDRGALNP